MLDDERGGRNGRRVFLSAASALGAAGLLGLPRASCAEAPPEVRKIRLLHTPAVCLAPQYLAEDLLRMEGFTDVEYVAIARPGSEVLAAAGADLSMYDVPSLLPVIDAGKPVVVVAGVHAGCYELVANERLRTIRDLRGKRIATTGYGDSDNVLLSSMLAYVGVNPRTDVEWVIAERPASLFVEGRADAFLGFAPQPHELRRKHIGHVIVNTAQDRPWSQYFCCVVAGNKEFVRANPAATKRAIRAILKAADICAQEPERAARYMAEKGYEKRYDIGLEVLKELPYHRWRDASPEDTLRFHALRLHEVGMIKSTPQQIIAQGTDWRFFNELRRELKA